MNEIQALKQIKQMVESKVVKNEGESVVPPSFLDIYNIACQGLGECHSSDDGVIDCSVTSPDTSVKNLQSS